MCALVLIALFVSNCNGYIICKLRYSILHNIHYDELVSVLYLCLH